MKLIDGVVAFFTTVFDSVFSFLGLIKKGLEYVVNNRAAIVTAVVGTVKAAYDFTVAQLNKALESFNGLSEQVSQVGAGSGVGEFLAFGNTIFPLSETMTVAILLFELWVVCLIVKLILRFIPGL